MAISVSATPTGDRIQFMFGSRVGFSGTADGAIFDLNKFKMAAAAISAAILDNFEWPYLRNSSRSTYIARIARSSLRWHSFLVSYSRAASNTRVFASTRLQSAVELYLDTRVLV